MSYLSRAGSGATDPAGFIRFQPTKGATVEIIVFVKQVPATESIIEIAEDGRGIQTEGLKWVMNPYDELAVEEAIRIREAQGGTVTILSVGPEKAKETIRVGLAMGADKGVLINDSAALATDGLGTARILAAAAKNLGFDLILAGQRAVDDDNYLAGPAAAELLDIPHIALAIKVEVADGRVRCRRTVEGGTMTVTAPLPALLTTQRGLNEPRYASLPGIMKAKKKPIAEMSPADLGLDAGALAPQMTVVGMSHPPERGAGRMIEGESPAEVAETLVRLLHEEAKVI